MKIVSLSILSALLLLAACKDEKKKDKETRVEVIDSLMNVQQTAWNNGNIDGFMAQYWRSDSLLFIGKKGVTNGWNKTLENYRKSYPDKAAMGRLEFNVVKHETIGKKAVYTIGKWTLYRSADTLGGHFTLLWKKVNGDWKIVADHTS